MMHNPPVHRRAPLCICGGALLFLMLVASPGCRRDSAAVDNTQAIPFRPSFSTGDRHRYDLYDLDLYGSYLPSTKRSLWRRVAGIHEEAVGATGVTVFVDSSGTDSARVDTVYMQFRENGDVWQYGFAAAPLGRFSGGPRWDLVAAFSAGARSFWRVGWLDSAGTLPVFGEIEDQVDYFAVNVDGTSLLIPAYRVNYTSSDFEGSLWLAEAPASLPRCSLLLGPDTTGTLSVLMQIVHAAATGGGFSRATRER